MHTIKEFDGLKLVVQFYANNGALNKVAESSGVPIHRLERWLEKDILFEEDREKLLNGDRK